MSKEIQTFRVENEDPSAHRLDLFLSVKTGRSRAYVKLQISKAAVSVNRAIVDKPSQKLRLGDVVEVKFGPEKALDLVPVEKPLDILFEDADLIVINKPQGWVVHPAAGHKGETLVHYLLYHMQHSTEFRETSGSRPGIVHRLDRGTSGCLIVAKNRTALEKLAAQFKIRAVKKQYEAIVYGKMKESGSFRNSIGRHPTDRKKMSSRTLEARDAVTDWKKAEAFPHFTLVDCFPLTGRTHQLRVHLSEGGHPIVGDPLYGKRAAARMNSHLHPSIEAAIAPLENPFLHARKLSFFQPSTGKPIEVDAKRPEGFDQFVSLLREHDREREK
jgi:23S rRNA pseudouridine1911/1915/1917 synthase